MHLGAKELSLLAYLALEPGPHSREELAALLWGESPDADARASLRQALKHLRDAIGPLLTVERGSASVDPAISCDVMAFRHAARADCAAAASFDVPHALTSLSVRHAPAFEEWAEQTRVHLMREYQEVLATLGREAIGRHAWGEALQVADQWLAADPLAEPAIRLAVEASYLAGDRRAALARYAQYRQQLERETGDAPGRDLVALIRRVESDAASSGSPSPSPAGWSADVPALQAALVERDPEWRALVAAWRALGPGAGGIMLLEGEAGVGKSRLAEEFLRWAVAEGGTVLRGRGYGSRAGVPYGALVEIVRDSLDQPGIGGTAADWLSEVARLLPEIRERFPGLPPAAASGDPMQGNRLSEGIAQMLTALSAERPVVVAIDDLQWCDEESCNLLLYLARRLERAPILWLGMLTLGQLERDAPTARLCRVWRTKPHAASATLMPLSDAGVWSLVSALGHLEDTPETRLFSGRLHEVTAGNPFYLQELLKTLFAQNVLREGEGTHAWVLPGGNLPNGALDVPMPRSVQDAIAERVERLPEDAHAVLVTVAVADAGCDTELLSHVHGISRLHAASLGDALVERRLLVEDEDAYRCAHPVIARVVRDGLSPSRRREVHRALALTFQALTPVSAAGRMARVIARHAELGGERGLAFQSALAASRAATELAIHEEALSWLDQAASYARNEEETAEVNRLTAQLVDGGATTASATT